MNKLQKQLTENIEYYKKHLKINVQTIQNMKETQTWLRAAIIDAQNELIKENLRLRDLKD